MQQSFLQVCYVGVHFFSLNQQIIYVDLYIVSNMLFEHAIS